MPVQWPADWPRTLLVGAGVVGSAVADAHLDRQIPFVLADPDSSAIDRFQRSLETVDVRVHRREDSYEENVPCILVGEVDDDETSRQPIAIESIVEKPDVKGDLFRSLQAKFGPQLTLCSNTSTLRIAEIAGSLESPECLVGMHFFMPVHLRGAVELIRGESTDRDSLDRASAHAKRLGKHVVNCGDSPGFIVNRMLSPYLNQSLLLLCRGISETRLRRAALAYGMPLSPLELIDWIGAPTMFHAGRAFWQAFPKRVDPSPLVPGLVKSGRVGRASGAGLYDYESGTRSESLAPETLALVERYRDKTLDIGDGEILKLLSIPMWIEAQSLLAEGVADSMDSIDVAMVGGLGFDSDQTWSEFFAELGEDVIQQAIETWSQTFRSMNR